MRAVCILAVAAVLSILATACGGSDSSTFVATPPPTPFPLDALRAQAAPLCTAASAGTAQRGTTAPVAPIASYWRQDDSGLERKYQTGNIERDWKSYTGVTYKVRNSFETEWLTGFKLERPEDVRGIVCIHERWVGVGTYERSEALAVRRDWTVRILSWPDGAIVAERSFRGGDPPATRETTGGQGGCAVCTEAGVPPAKEAHAWLHSLLDSPAASGTQAPSPATITPSRTPAPATATATIARTATASATATRMPSPIAGGSTAPGCTLCGVHNLPGGATLDVRANAYEGWNVSADGTELTLRLRRGATARVTGASCTELDPQTLRCPIPASGRIIADGTAP